MPIHPLGSNAVKQHGLSQTTSSNIRTQEPTKLPRHREGLKKTASPNPLAHSQAAHSMRNQFIAGAGAGILSRGLIENTFGTVATNIASNNPIAIRSILSAMPLGLSMVPFQRGFQNTAEAKVNHIAQENGLSPNARHLISGMAAGLAGSIMQPFQVATILRGAGLLKREDGNPHLHLAQHAPKTYSAGLYAMIGFRLTEASINWGLKRTLEDKLTENTPGRSLLVNAAPGLAAGILPTPFYNIMATQIQHQFSQGEAISIWQALEQMCIKRVMKATMVWGVTGGVAWTFYNFVNNIINDALSK